MVFGDMHSALVRALYRYSWPDDLGQAVNVDGQDTEPLLYVLPHLLGPWLSAEYAQAEPGIAQVYAHVPGGFVQDERVGGGAGDNSGTQVL
ncbi:hypothetical protein ES703_63344 [subsurface metagenome]